jgi:amino acid adenylation domain-containing protein
MKNINSHKAKADLTKSDSESFPLNNIQEAYFLGKQIQNKFVLPSHTYHEIEVDDLNIARLKHTWDVLVEYHEMLRTVITKNGRQKVLGQIPSYELMVHEIKNDEEKEQHFACMRSKMLNKVYKPNDWPLFEIVVTQLPKKKAIIHFVLDSWVADSTSASILLKQWYQLYHNHDFVLPEKQICFRDSVLMRQDLEKTEKYNKAVAYWHDKFAARNINGGNSLFLREHDHAQNPIFNRKKLLQRINKDDWLSLKQKAGALNVSASCLLLTIFAEIIAAWTTDADFSIIMTLYNRPLIMHKDISKLVGPFTSLLIFNIAKSNESFVDKLISNKKQIWSDINHSLADGIVALRQYSKKTGKTPSIPIVFTSLINTNNTTEQDSFQNHVVFSIIQTPNNALEFQVCEKDSDLFISWDYTDEYFLPETIDLLFSSYTSLLKHLSIDNDIWRESRAVYNSPYRFSPFKRDSLPVNGDVPLTALQQAYAAANVNKKSTVVYHDFRVTDLDIAKLEQTWNILVNHYAVLKTIITKSGTQRIEKNIPYYQIPVLDLRTELNLSCKLERVQNQRKEMSTKTRQLGQWPYFDLVISRLSDSEYVLHISLDMLILDGASIRNLLAQLFRLYSSPNLDFTVQSAYQANRYQLNDPFFSVFKRYWHNKIKSIPTGPDLKGTLTDANGARQRLQGNLLNWSQLKQIACEYELKPASILITAYCEAILECNDFKPFTIVLVHWDHDSEIKEICNNELGDFSLLSWISYEKSEKSFFEKVRALEAQIEQDKAHSRVCGLEGIKSVLSENPTKSLNFPVVFTNFIGLHSFHDFKQFKKEHSISNTPGVILDCVCEEIDDFLHFHMDYVDNPENAKAVGNVFANFCQILERLAVADTAQNAIKESQAIAADIQRRVLYDWNDTARPYNKNCCLHELFEQQAQKYPDNTAVIHKGATFTYQQLNRRANQVARYLQTRGVKTAERIGISLNRSFDFIAALLGILKAGCAYVPLTIDSPEQRLATVVDKAELTTIITSAEYVHLFDSRLKIIDFDKEHTLIDQEKGDNLNKIVDSLTLAYIIFTSGSTGTPKGIAISHRPVVNLIEWAQKEFGFGPHDCCLFVTPISFDLSVFDVFGFLAYGAKIFIADDEERRNSKYLADVLCNEPITFWNSAPAVLQTLMPFLKLVKKPVKNEQMRLFFLSGDWIPLTLPGAITNWFTNAHVISLGGATETTVWANYFPIHEVKSEWNSIPYGRPIQNARYYILDEVRKLCQVGQIGELYIAGDCLANGYFNDPEITKASFVEHEFNEGLKEILFKTGDLARFFPDGNIELIGRIDSQVKVRGFRIELQEIEIALRKIGFDEAICLIRKDNKGENQLVSFIKDLKDVDKNTIDTSLKSILPDYMHPSRYLFLSSFPVTENGKVDRKFLSQEQYEIIYKNHGVFSSQTESTKDHAKKGSSFDDFQTEIAGMIATILNEDNTAIDPQNNLGEYGFNSLQYAILSAELSDKYGIDINPTVFYQYSSIQKITNYISQNNAELIEKFYNSKIKAPPKVSVQPILENKTIIQDIAVVGISGRMPQAPNLDIFWENLIKEMNCVDEIPAGRWDWQEYYGNPQKEENKSFSKWGGFIDDIDCFDAAFFGISPREAQLMDPRQKLLLEEIYKAIENAGHAPVDFYDRAVGVFIGVSGNEFADLSRENDFPIDNYTLTGISHTIITSRISYYFNLHGPSETIDTACSGGLVAITNAIRAIQNGECEAAIAGAINIIMDPKPHIYLSKIGMLSPDGACKTFDKSANGYVRGEGIGVVILKPLEKAIEDRNHIYGVIKKAVVNHDGRANSLTSPNPEAQCALLYNAYKQAKIDPAALSLLETHGTGTELGDPIEINAIKEAFQNLYQDWGKVDDYKNQKTCGLGAVKTNIGHLEAAAGIAGFLKCLLVLKNKILPANIHLQHQNPYIQLENTPFYLLNEAHHLKHRVLENGERLPLRTAVSSFGYGGVNAHVIVEEYFAPEDPVTVEHFNDHLIVISAETNDGLRQCCRNLLSHIEALEQQGQIANEAVFLSDLAFTLQAGRKHLKERLALLVETLPVLKGELRQFCQSDAPLTYALFRTVSKNTTEPSESLRLDINKVCRERDLKKIAHLWLDGYQINWADLYHDASYAPKRLPLPTYPFRRQKFALPKPVRKARKVLHPLIDENLSTADRMLFLKTFNKDESILKEHVIDKQMLLPGAAYLEMVYSAYKTVAPNALFGLKNHVWLSPYVFDNSNKAINVVFFENDNKTFYQVCDAGNKQIVYCSGEITFESKNVDRHLDVEALLAKYDPKYLDKESFYQKIEDIGIEYGRSFKVVDSAVTTEDLSIAKVRISESDYEKHDQYNFYPITIDAALQLALIHTLYNQDQGALFIPYSIEKVHFYAPLTKTCYVLVSNTSNNEKILRYNIKVVSEHNDILLELENCYARRFQKSSNSNKNDQIQDLYFYKQELVENELVVASEDLKDPSFVVFDPYNQIHGSPGIVVKQQGVFQQVNNRLFYLDFKKEDDFLRLFSMVGQKGDVIKFVFLIPSLEIDSELETQLANGYFALLFIYKALLKNNMSARFIFQYTTSERLSFPAFSALSGLFKTLVLESPQFSYKLIECKTDGALPKVADLLRIAFAEINSSDGDNRKITYDHQTRYQTEIVQTDLNAQTELCAILKDKGTYIITGGTGKIGLMFARFLSVEYNANLALVGSSPLTLEKQELINSIGSESIIYIQSSLSSKEAVKQVIIKVKDRFSSINGLIHAAGKLKDSLLINKQVENTKQVFAPKVFATQYLFEELINEPLDFFVCFSSLVAHIGNIGQSDYAYANCFMNHFAQNLEGKRKLKKFVSISWPLWLNGGMTVSDEVLKKMEDTFGILPLADADGLNAFKKIISSDEENIIVLKAATPNAKNVFTNKSSVGTSEQRSEEPGIQSNDMRERTLDLLKKIIAAETQMPYESIDESERMESYGIDSIMIISLTTKLEDTFGELSKTLFFEYQTINELSDYFMKKYYKRLQDLFPAESPQADVLKEEIVLEQKMVFANPAQPDLAASDDIAIIGISGRYPLASNLEELWKNLKEGRDCITEIPESRWDWRDYYDPDKSKVSINKSYSKWGGFVDDADQFDPYFFNITPIEALLMDPQERMFLETVWHAFEDAAIAKTDLKNKSVGVYVGVMWGQYQLYGIADASAGSSYASIANRISYYFDLNGPSIALDTMCSSSLTSIHLACESLALGEIDVAVAGGVNINAHPNKYLFLCKTHFASTDGRCRSFGAGGDGYVPSEGVGGVILKKLDNAIRDRDHIHGVIKSSVINHNGKTNGYTVPSPNAQTKIVRAALKKASLEPSSLNYIETHGTGTALGDPIEVTGLVNAYGQNINKKQFCALGSIKSNIGHAESAAGIASLTKVLLQMKHKQLVPSIHSEPHNPNINFAGTPFYVQKQLSDWPQLKEGNQAILPRRAGVSSFGAGGANAFLILEEYNHQPEVLDLKGPFLFVLSVQMAEALQPYVKSVLAFIKQNRTNQNISFANFIYTLQVGRNHLPVKIAAIVNNYDELSSILQNYLDKKEHHSDLLFIGNANKHKQMQKETAQFLEILIKNKLFNKLAAAWVAGNEIQWEQLYEKETLKPRRLSLPLLQPFVKQRYWVEGAKTAKQLDQDVAVEDKLSNFFSEPSWHLVEELKKDSGKINFETALFVDVSHTRKFGDLLKMISPDIHYINLNDSGFASESLRDMLVHVDGIDSIYFIAFFDEFNKEHDLSSFEAIQNRIFFKFFDFVHDLLNSRFSDKALKLTVLVNNVYQIGNEPLNPYVANLIGFTRAINKEIPSWDIKTVDIDLALIFDPELSQQLLYLATKKSQVAVFNEGETAIRRAGRYERFLHKTTLSPSGKYSFKAEGVYLIIGGAGNVGFKFSKYLATNYKAKLIWLGRKDKEAVAEKIDSITKLGGSVEYFQVDITDYDQMHSVFNTLKARNIVISGITHSAMNYEYKPLLNLDEQSLKNILNPKVLGSFVLYKTLKEVRLDGLDFMLFFSSGESFTGNPGWASYAAACTFNDVLAAFIRQELKIETKIINWGFWEDNDAEQNDKLRSTGIYPITYEEGMDVIGRVLASDREQILALNVSSAIAKLMGITPQEEAVIDDVNSEETPFALKHSTEDLNSREISKEAVIDYLKSKFSAVLKMDKAKFDNDTDFMNYGIDSIRIMDIHLELEKDLKKLQVDTLLNNTTLESLSHYLLTNHKESLSKFLKMSGAVETQAGNPTAATKSKANGTKLQLLDFDSDTFTFLATYGTKYQQKTLLKNIHKEMTASHFQDLVNNDASKIYHLMVDTPLCAKTEVFVTGAGPTLLLIAPVALTASSWIKQFSALYSQFRLVVVHQPGTGLTQRIKDPSITNIAKMMVDVLEGLNIDGPFHVIGSCFGGLIAQAIAYHYHERISSLTLVGSFFQNIGLPNISLEDMKIEEINGLVSQLTASIGLDFDSLITKTEFEDLKIKISKDKDLLVNNVCSDSLYMMKYIIQILSISTLDWLKKIKASTLVVVGSEDTIVKKEISSQIHAILPNSSYVEIANAGHYPYLTHEETFNPILVDFMRKNDNGAEKNDK